jgi:prepilin-type N-terminal cleavage/methylation domain-containing protein
MNYKNRGFTLIELLVVISIIGLLSSIILIMANKSRAKARDGVRLLHMNQIQNAMAKYLHDNNGAWPEMSSAISDHDPTNCYTHEYDSSNVDGDNDGKRFMEFLHNSNYFPNGTPVDPLNTGVGCSGYVYIFSMKPIGYQGCPADFYLIGVSRFETIQGVHPSSPKFNCGTMSNWYQNFGWFGGDYEK